MYLGFLAVQDRSFLKIDKYLVLPHVSCTPQVLFLLQSTQQLKNNSISSWQLEPIAAGWGDLGCGTTNPQWPFRLGWVCGLLT